MVVSLMCMILALLLLNGVQSQCRGNVSHADLIFAVPGSSKVHELEFQSFEENLINLLGNLSIEPNEFNIGLILYGENAINITAPQPFKTRTQINTELMLLIQRRQHLHALGSLNNVAKAIDTMMNMFIHPPAGNSPQILRPAAQHIGIFFTYGPSPSTNVGEVIEAASKAKAANILMYALSANGSSEDFPQIATDYCRLFSLGRFETGLPSVMPYLVHAICSALDPAVTVTAGNCFPTMVTTAAKQSTTPLLDQTRTATTTPTSPTTASQETTSTKEDTKQLWTMTWIAATFGLCLLIFCVTAIACWCIRRKKRKMAPKVVQLNELQQPSSPQEFNDNNDHDDVSLVDNNDDNSDHYDIMPVEGYDDNSDHYDVLPYEGNDDNSDHYDVFPDDGHDNFVVPYAVVPSDITEREATSRFPSLQMKDTYVLGRIAESETSVETRFAVGEEIDNTVPYAVVPFNITEREAPSMYPSLQIYPQMKDTYVLGRIAESETSVRTRFAVGEKLDNTVPYAVVPFDITEREATSMNPSLQMKDTYVLGRIAESEASVGTRFAVGEEIDNAATSETNFLAAGELVNVAPWNATNGEVKYFS